MAEGADHPMTIFFGVGLGASVGVGGTVGVGAGVGAAGVAVGAAVGVGAAHPAKIASTNTVPTIRLRFEKNPFMFILLMLISLVLASHSLLAYLASICTSFFGLGQQPVAARALQSMASII